VSSVRSIPPVGSYQYDKRHPTGALAVHVTVFRLEDTDELATWPECYRESGRDLVCWKLRQSAAPRFRAWRRLG
jgi:hypothetical protein